MIRRLTLKIGLLFIIAALSLTLYNIYEGYLADLSSRNVMKQIKKKVKGYEVKRVYEYSDRDMPTIYIDGHYYVGWITIPSLKLDLPVMDTWSYPHLRISPCRYEGTVYKRNMIVAGHNYAKHFSRIKGLKNGEKVIFTDVEGSIFYYRVSYQDILYPNENEKLVKEDDKWDLTMFTCTWGGERRFVLRCSLEF